MGNSEYSVILSCLGKLQHLRLLHWKQQLSFLHSMNTKCSQLLPFGVYYHSKYDPAVIHRNRASGRKCQLTKQKFQILFSNTHLYLCKAKSSHYNLVVLFCFTLHQLSEHISIWILKKTASKGEELVKVLQNFFPVLCPNLGNPTDEPSPSVVVNELMPAELGHSRLSLPEQLHHIQALCNLLCRGQLPHDFQEMKLHFRIGY